MYPELQQPLFSRPQQPQVFSDYQPAAPPPPQASTKFTSQGWKDVAWAALFLLHLVGYIGGGLFFLNKYKSELTAPAEVAVNSSSPYNGSEYVTAYYPHYIVNPLLYDSSYSPSPHTGLLSVSNSSGYSNATSTDDHIRLQRDVIYIGLSSLALSAAVAVLWLSLAKTYARGMIYMALVSDIAVSVLLALLCLYYGSVVGAVILGLFAVLKAVWVYWMRSRIEFAAVVLTIAVHCIQQWPATVLMALLSIVVQAAWVVGWGFVSVGFYYAATRVSGTTPDGPQTGAGTQPASSQPQQEDGSLSYVVLFVMLVSFYWTSQVIKNTLHVTVSGVAATWYFLFPQAQPSNPTLGSFKRAVTTSFGSICLGSLILSVIRALRVVVNIAANEPGNGGNNGGAAAARACAYCIAQCCLSILDRVVEYVNKYAFAQVAIYGSSFCEGAQATVGLFKVRGFDALINDSVIGIALGFACLMGGLTSAAACSLLSYSVFTAAGSWLVWGLIGFLFGFAMTMLATEVVESAVVALFVCLCEDPAALQRSKPDVYARLVPAIQSRYPSINMAPL